MIEQSHAPHQIANLGCQTVSSKRLADGRLGYGLTNHSVQLLDLTRNNVETVKTNHTKRLNKFDARDSLLATSSNDGTVRLYDLRTLKQTVSFKKNQEEFYSVAMEGNTVAAGATGSVTFWDVRKSKPELGCFSESFVEDVTDLQMKGNMLYGCSLDGMVTCFDITKIQDDATEWNYKFVNPVEEIRIQNEHTLIHTADHHLGLLLKGELLKKYSPNTPQVPKHLFWSQFSGGNVSYYVWNINNEKIEKWVNEQNTMQALHTSDVDFLQQITPNAIVTVDGFGNVYALEMKIPQSEAPQPQPQADLFIQSTDIVQGGLIKPSYKKRAKKDYRPF